MKRTIVRVGFGLSIILVILLFLTVSIAIFKVQSGPVTRLAVGFLVMALLDLLLFANMWRRLPRTEPQEGEAGD